MPKTKLSKKISKPDSNFYAEISDLLQKARSAAYRTVNFVMVQTYWQIGKRIVEQEQKGKNRADYGDYLIVNLSRYLSDTFGKGFSEANLRNFRLFYNVFPDLDQFATQRVTNLNRPQLANFDQFATQRVTNLNHPQLTNFDQFATQCVANLTWSHWRLIIRLESKEERDYYIKETAEQNWSVRNLERNIQSGYFKRLLSSQSKKIRTQIESKLSAIDFVKDPYFLEFLNVPENLKGKETILENALINNMQNFMLELGKGFSFVARQMRISTETDHFYLDLVFYNYILKCFVIIDLKTTKLTHADIGQMDMYVRMFDTLKKGESDNPTIGIIMCSDKSEVMVKYSILKENKQIFASKYKTILPTEKKLAELLYSNKR